MIITRFFETADHRSAFEQRRIPFPEHKTDAFGHVLELSENFAADCMLTVLPVGLDQDWHNAPNRQLVVVLCGTLEVESGSGETRRWQAGELFMADDTGGQGHRTRVINGPVQLLFVRLPENFDVACWPLA